MIRDSYCQWFTPVFFLVMDYYLVLVFINETFTFSLTTIIVFVNWINTGLHNMSKTSKKMVTFFIHVFYGRFYIYFSI